MGRSLVLWDIVGFLDDFILRCFFEPQGGATNGLFFEFLRSAGKFVALKESSLDVSLDM